MTHNDTCRTKAGKGPGYLVPGSQPKNKGLQPKKIAVSSPGPVPADSVSSLIRRVVNSAEINIIRQIPRTLKIVPSLYKALDANESVQPHLWAELQAVLQLRSAGLRLSCRASLPDLIHLQTTVLSAKRSNTLLPAKLACGKAFSVALSTTTMQSMYITISSKRKASFRHS